MKKPAQWRALEGSDCARLGGCRKRCGRLKTACAVDWGLERLEHLDGFGILFDQLD